MVLQGYKLKHIEAFLSQNIGKVVGIISITIDPDFYFEPDENGKYQQGTDYQLCTITYSEHGKDWGKKTETVDLQWLCDVEEFI